MPYCSKCGYYQDEPFATCPKCSGTAPKPHKRSKTKSTIMNVMTWVIGIGFIAFIVALMFLPQLEPLKDKGFDYLNEGLRHYNEYPEYADLVIEREFTVKANDNDIDYTIKLVRPPELSREYPYFSSQKFKVQEVLDFQVTILSDGGSSYTIENGNVYNITGHINRGSQDRILVDYKMRTYTFAIDMTPSEAGKLPARSELPGAYRELSSRRQWEVGDLDGDGRMDEENEDLNPTPPFTGLDPGEDTDHDGTLDVDEDIDDDGNWDWRIDPISPMIQQKARELRGSEDNSYMVLKSFFDWVVNDHAYPTPDQMQYDAVLLQGKPKAAVRTMEDGYGDCDDQSILFISLCRSVGIPAWLECGALYNPFGNLIGTQWEAHGWANVYIPLADGGHIIGTVDCVNHEFLIRDSLRLAEWEDDGVGNHLQDYYTSFSYTRTFSGSGDPPSMSDHFNSVDVNAHPSDLKIKV